MRIRGMIGDWPVDLQVELDEQDWARLTAQRPVEAPVAAEPAPAAASTNRNDVLWQTTLDLLRQAGQVDGPELLAQLSALTGSAAAAKQLLVRLRHSPLVQLENGADTPLYRWVG